MSFNCWDFTPSDGVLLSSELRPNNKLLSFLILLEFVSQQFSPYFWISESFCSLLQLNSLTQSSTLQFVLSVSLWHWLLLFLPEQSPIFTKVLLSFSSKICCSFMEWQIGFSTSPSISFVSSTTSIMFSRFTSIPVVGTFLSTLDRTVSEHCRLTPSLSVSGGNSSEHCRLSPSLSSSEGNSPITAEFFSTSVV